MIAAAVIAVQAKDLLSSVIAIGAVGIGLSMVFLALKAPDLAIMQLVVEILSLIILIRATIRKDLPFSVSGRWFFNTSSVVLFLIVFLTAANLALKKTSSFGSPAMGTANIYIEGAKSLKVANVVASITLHFRALDTLGEVTILFTTIVGVLAIARKVGHEKADRS
jgi:multisubunit Na+/H+ antiporter MnhB subunit